MGARHRSRELAMQALYFMDMSDQYSEEMLEIFCTTHTPSTKVRPFFCQLVNGVIHSKSEIDTIISKYSSNWKMNRMSCVDRNAIRIAVYEMLFCQDIPFKVSINEAIDVGKKFGSEESGSFINGILDSIRMALERGEIDKK